MKESRIGVWDYQHAEDNKKSLSNCQYQETLDFLHLNNVLKQGDKVLEVGVGMGHVTNGFRERGFSISGFDISPIGLERVRNVCDAVYAFEDLENIPSNTFDVVLCNNVAQHMPTPLLSYEMFHFIRILKKDGLLAVKSVATDIMEDTGDDSELVVQHIKIPRPDGKLKCDESIGCFCRSVVCFAKIIDRCGGIVKLISNVPCNVWHITETHIFHITKKTKEDLLK